MTTPSPFPVEAPDLISVGAQSLVSRAKSLGLTWTRRLATVQEGSDPSNISIILDADTVEVSATSMLGRLSMGDRVFVDMIPPAGNFIVGLAILTSLGRGIIGRAESASNSAAVGAEAVVLTIKNCLFGAGRGFAISINSDLNSSVANVGTYQVRIPNLVGTVIAIPWQGPSAVGAANNDGVNKTVYVRRASAAGDLLTDVVLTLSATAGTITAQGGATFVRYFQIEDVGDESLFPACFAI